MPSNKCWNCERRHVGCHADCEDYAEYRAKQDALLKAKEAERVADYLCMQRTIAKAAMHAMKRKARRK